MTWDCPFAIELADAAAEWFLGREAMTGPEYEAATEAARRDAFWLRRVTEASIVEDVYASLTRALEEGLSVEEWRATEGGALVERWAGTSSELVLRNWTASAYSQERRAALLKPEVLADRPKWLFDGIGDSRQSPICAACDGVVADATDPWWQTHTPPLHHQCRSGIISLSEDDMADLGVTRRPVPVQASPGWGDPEAVWRPSASEARPEV